MGSTRPPWFYNGLLKHKDPIQVAALTEQLSKKRWFVVAGIRVVPSDNRASGKYNSIRYFHGSDQALAKDLQNTSNPSKRRGQKK
jgi:hypothetical protein